LILSTKASVGIDHRTAVTRSWIAAMSAKRAPFMMLFRRGDRSPQAPDQDPSFLRTIVTGDEIWCYQFDPESKRQSMEWRSPPSPRPKKSRLQKSKVKTMLIVFFDSDSIIHKEFVPVGQTVNSTFYEEVLKRLLRRIHHVRPGLHRTGQWMLLRSVSTNSWLSAAYPFSIIHRTPLIWHLRTSFCFPA